MRRPDSPAKILAQASLGLRRKVYVSLALLIVVILFQTALPHNPALLRFYSNWVFKPWQSARNQVFGLVSWSVGDRLYIIGLLALIVGLLRAIYFLVRFSTHSRYLGNNLLNTFITLTTIYLLFFIGWGGNYYRPKLAKVWNLHIQNEFESGQLHHFDSFLIQKLNSLAPQYQQLSFKAINQRAISEYQCCTDSRTSLKGLQAKPSLVGYFMQYLGIQGYYNPWTGEAQVNAFLPEYMLPFVVCHEMAHQSGIAAEDDANLLSYAICTRSSLPAFQYSGYFNLWLYTHTRLHTLDSNLALASEAGVNALTLHHRDTLRIIRRQYRSPVGIWTASAYDAYLRMHDQKEGIRSYGKVSLSAQAFEEVREQFKGHDLHLP